MRRRATGCVLAAAMAVLAVAGTVGSPAAEAAETGSVLGAMFDDANRNGVRDAGEAPFAGRTVAAFDATSGSFVAGAGTGADGSFAITGLPAGTYRVQVAAPDWWELRGEWVPTTTGSVWFRHDAVAAGGGTSARADLGLRRIVWSTTPGEPLSEVTAPDGLRVESYTDAVPAAAVLTELDAGSLRGGEAATTTVRFGLDGTDYTVSSVAGAPGGYTDFSATVWTAYVSWLDQTGTLLHHEYGHAWARYHDTVGRQDGAYAGYLEARGLDGDSRLGTSHAWTPAELIAEDYRQLFGSTGAAASPQENRDVPTPDQVPGLETWLRDTFTQPVTGSAGGGTGGTGGSGGGDTEQPPVETPTITDLGVVDPATTPVDLRFSMAADAAVTVVIVDGRGRVVRSLLDAQPLPAGPRVVPWDRIDDRARLVREGTFTVRVTAENAAGRAEGSATFTLVSATSGSGTKGGPKR